jgi:hypothetical protein
MHEFAIVALLGLAVYAVVNLIRQIGQTSRALRIFLDLALGLIVAWVTDYSMFAGWGVSFRSLWMGPAATGLVIGGLASLWTEVVGFITSYARRSYDEATEIESRIQTKAA